MDTIFNFLANNYPWMLVVAILITATVVVTVHVMNRLNAITHVKKDVTELKVVAKCELHAADISSTKTSVLKVEDLMSKISNDLSYLKGVIGTSKMQNPLTESHSPVGLSEKGLEVAKEMDIYNIVDANWINIMSLIETHASSYNAYDIQQYCIEEATVALDKLFKPEDVDKIKLFAYNEGQTLAYYGMMIGVIIRDKYFHKKNIPILDIDTYDPNK